MAGQVVEKLNWSMSRSSKSYRTYDITWLVETATDDDGPSAIMYATGLPLPGTSWQFGNTIDYWAQCTWDLDIKMHNPEDGHPRGNFWEVRQKFTNDPGEHDRQDQVDNPLNEPFEISGGWNLKPREATLDKDDKLILYSSHEQIRGDSVTRNQAFPTVDVAMNLADIPLAVIKTAIGRVNSVSMWGLGPRTIRLENAPWQRKVLPNRFVYYRINYQYEANFNTWDEEIIDQGTRTLVPGGDKDNPAHFEKATTGKGEKETEPVLLNGEGKRLEKGDDPHILQPKIDKEFNFFLLGMPRRL